MGAVNEVDVRYLAAFLYPEGNFC